MPKPRQWYNHLIDEDQYNSFMDDVGQFHEKYELEYKGEPRFLPLDLSTFRLKFMQEELDEYQTARSHMDLAGQLDALGDLLYVVLGTAYLHGFDLAEAWRRIHASNMQKVRTKKFEDSTRGSAFDVVKPPGWEPPFLKDLV